MVVKISPIAALRGEFRVRKENLRIRKKNAFSMIFGVEGDYAYKNVMRSPARFHKTVWALGLGMAVFIGLMTFVNAMYAEQDKLISQYKYYQHYYENRVDADDTSDDVKVSLPSAANLEKIQKLDDVAVAKRAYTASVTLADVEENYNHYSQEYLTHSWWGQYMKDRYEYVKKESTKEKPNEQALAVAMENLSETICYGYDDEDYQRYEEVLEDGTLDVSENGIVLVKSAMMECEEEENLSDLLLGNMNEIQISDYQVGDQIKILDLKRYRELVSEEMEEVKRNYRQGKYLYETEMDEEDWTEQAFDLSEYYEKRRTIMEKYRKQLIAQGAYKSYTIEGIVSEDVNHEGNEYLTFVLPLERYYELTGTDESYVSGMKYHLNKNASVATYKMLDEISDYDGMEVYAGLYPSFMLTLNDMKGILIGVLIGIVFFITMVSFNIINTTASSIYLRRKEFAQLRVVGMSKKRLLKMVLLEGIIQSLAANVIGIALGYGMCRTIFSQIMRAIFGIKAQFPLVGTLIGVIVSTLILCGSIYVPIREMKMNMAQDLADTL